MNPTQIAYLAILAAALVLFVTEWLGTDIIAVLIVLALYSSGLLDPRQALSGFSSEPALIVAAIFVITGAMRRTGLSDTLGSLIARTARGGTAGLLAVVMPAVALLSAFTHHLTLTAVMLPVALGMSRERKIPPSKLLMPISFAASLGTTITIIGAPAFLIADEVLRKAGRPGLGIFSIAPIGLALAAAGTLFMVLVGHRLLPSRRGGADGAARFRQEEYLTEVTVRPDSPFLEKTAAEIESDPRHPVKVVGWIREGRRSRPPFKRRKAEAGDVLVVRAAPEELLAIRAEPRIELHPVEQYGDGRQAGEGPKRDVEESLVQAVIAPDSDLIGQTVGEVDFRRRFGAIVVGFLRKGGKVREELSRIRLRPGDVLVLVGDEDSLNRVSGHRSFLMLVPFHGEARLRRKAWLAAGIMVVTVIAASLQLWSLDLVILAGAAAVVITGCLSARQAYRSIDLHMYVFIAGAIPLGLAMDSSGTSSLIAGWLQSVLGGWSQTAILFACFAVVGVLTQFMSDAATTAIFAPVAAALARSLGHPPEPYVVTVAMASIVSFFTPIGHHGNLLVYGPGGYRFLDFVRVGTPLTAVAAVVVVFLAQVLWPG